MNLATADCTSFPRIIQRNLTLPPPGLTVVFALAENLWLLKYPLSVMGTNHGRNVTIIRLNSGRLIIHSLAPFSRQDVSAIQSVGTPAWLVEAMLLHDTFTKEGCAAFPDLPLLGPPGFAEVAKRPALPLLPLPAEWRDEIEVLPVEGAPHLQEHLVLHRPSRTLIVADLIVNFDAHERGWERFFHRHIAGFKSYPGTSRIFRLCVTDCAAFRASIEVVLSRDFDRIIVGHGQVIERDGKALLRRGLQNSGLLGSP